MATIDVSGFSSNIYNLLCLPTHGHMDPREAGCFAGTARGPDAATPDGEAMKKAAATKSSRKASPKAAAPKAAGRKAKKAVEVPTPVEQVIVDDQAIAPVREPVDEAPTVMEETRTIEPAEELIPLNEVHTPKGRSTGKKKAKGVATAKEPKVKSPSCLDAAAQVLKDKGQPMRCKELIEAMAVAGLWTSTAPTPAATLSSAILREITTKGSNSRFRKADRGLFTLTTPA
jgi:hypothetical protein